MMGCENRAHEESVVCTDFLLWAKSNTPSCFWAAEGVVELVPVRLCFCKNSLFSSDEYIYSRTFVSFPLPFVTKAPELDYKPVI